MKKPQPKPLNPNPVQQTAAFAPPPSGKVMVADLKGNTLEYWATIRIAWLAGYKLHWVIPGREGAVSGSYSVWDLRVDIRPEFDIHPARTAQYTLEPYVLVKGRPHQEPAMGTRVTVKTTVRALASGALSVGVQEAPPAGTLGETARWLPDPNTFTGEKWAPVFIPILIDENIEWEASEANAPSISDEFEYARRGQYITVTSMNMQASTYLRLNGMPLFDDLGTPYEPVTLIFVGHIVAPTQYWGSFLRAVEPDGSSTLALTNMDFRLMPDGNIHPFTWGWQYPLPLVGAPHTLSLFGFTLDVANKFLRMFTIDSTLRFSEINLPNQHSATSKFVLGRSAEAILDMDILDILMYRGAMPVEQIMHICSELDAAYGITAVLSQEQG